jgi:hypothetical protein
MKWIKQNYANLRLFALIKSLKGFAFKPLIPFIPFIPVNSAVASTGFHRF